MRKLPRKASIDIDPKVYINVLKLELDYHLMCLSDALSNGDITEQEIQKRTLEKIHANLAELGYFHD